MARIYCAVTGGYGGADCPGADSIWRHGSEAKTREGAYVERHHRCAWHTRRAGERYGRLTGCTVLVFPDGAVGGVDIRGSATGTREIDTLSALHLASNVHAITLAGGSAFGLDAAGGVMRALEEQGIGFPTRAARVPLVPAAIVYDLGIGSATRRPDADMGYAACRAAVAGRVEEGNAGAGTGATVGKLFGMEQAMQGGVGTASQCLNDSPLDRSAGGV